MARNAINIFMSGTFSTLIVRLHVVARLAKSRLLGYLDDNGKTYAGNKKAYSKNNDNSFYPASPISWNGYF